nr:hypothetical protein [uncultured Deefgea sp.]
MNADYRNTPQGHGSISLSDGSIYTLDAHPSAELNDRYIDCHLIPRCSICRRLLTRWQSFTHWLHNAWSQLTHQKI